ncbi:hypothetical protein ACFX2A_035087 [Malus domestica]
MRNFHPEIEAKIKVKVEKLLAVEFIKHLFWLANIIPVKKKNIVQIQICIDYRDLNAACPNDEFSLPTMDIMIDSTSGQSLMSFMDGFSGYNQIKMSAKDAKKIFFSARHLESFTTLSCHSDSKKPVLHINEQ